jgi:hypothetical protein
MFISRLSKQYRKIRKLDLRFNQTLTKSTNTVFIFLADRIPCEQVSLYASSSKISEIFGHFLIELES